MTQSMSNMRFSSMCCRLTEGFHSPCVNKSLQMCSSYVEVYTLSNKNPSTWNFLSPEPEVTCGTVAIIIRAVLLSPYLRIRAVSLPSIHYNQSHRVYINRRQQYICRSQWPRGLRRRSSAARLLRSWVRIPPRAWMFVLWVLCVVR